MMEFIMMTLSIALGVLLASVVGVIIMLQPKVMKLYMKKVYGLSMSLMEEITEEQIKEAEDL